MLSVFGGERRRQLNDIELRKQAEAEAAAEASNK
jgi:hypothetical protein